jgi:hypothetical protein
MRTLKTCAAVVAVLAMSNFAQAARTSARLCGKSKCCECAPTSIAPCCKPTIPRPCCTNVYTYQRQCSCLKPPCCDSGCCPKRGCRPRRNGCCNNDGCGNGCDPAGTCCNENCNNDRCRRSRRACGDVCGTPNCCQTPCEAPCQDNRCCANACQIAELIYQSQTGCYARTRRAALRRLAKYDCSCNPEIMSAFVYALNDAVETVRATAADAIGDQTRRHPCCCSPCIVNALTNALGDCDRRVRRAAEKSLCACGYEVVEACQAECVEQCGQGAGSSYSPATAPQATMAPEPTTAEIMPPPPAEPKAHVYKGDSGMHTVSSKRSLKNVFGLLH